MNQDNITIKGIRQGLLVILGDGEWADALRALEMRLDENPAFFRGGRVALDVGARELSRADIEQARTLLARNQVELWAVVSTSTSTESSVQEMGLVIDIGPRRPLEPQADEKSVDSTDVAFPDNMVVRRTLRSGQVLRHPGKIVVIGDVNPGAEVVAGGDVVVWGRVRGIVHAGALGDADAMICALDLAPTQLRIAEYITRSPEDKRRKPVPEIALVRDGQIIAVPWDSNEL